jgi:hypothetical protein
LDGRSESDVVRTWEFRRVCRVVFRVCHCVSRNCRTKTEQVFQISRQEKPLSWQRWGGDRVHVERKM